MRIRIEPLIKPSPNLWDAKNIAWKGKQLRFFKLGYSGDLPIPPFVSSSTISGSKSSRPESERPLGFLGFLLGNEELLPRRKRLSRLDRFEPLRYPWTESRSCLGDFKSFFCSTQVLNRNSPGPPG